MTTTTAADLLAATAEVWVERHRDRLNIRSGAAPDVLRRLLNLGALSRREDGTLTVQAGGQLDDLIGMIRASAAHLFRGPDEPCATAAPPAPKPRDLPPGARLALANGDTKPSL